MVAPQDTRKVLALLKKNKWIPVRKDGSHTWWKGPNGTGYPIPDGHREISPGVYRNLLKKIDEDKHK